MAEPTVLHLDAIRYQPMICLNKQGEKVVTLLVTIDGADAVITMPMDVADEMGCLFHHGAWPDEIEVSHV